MKKEKMVEVTICDFCKQERETRRCGSCGADACVHCSNRFDVVVRRWPEAAQIFTVMGENSQPSFSGIFCKQCPPDFVTLGFIAREKAA